MGKAVFIARDVVQGLVDYARHLHPEEGILLLRGKLSKDRIMVEEIVIPPFASRGRAFSSFPLFTLPMDASIVGVAHSHPSGHLKPSPEDLNNFYGRIMVIVGYPYRFEDVAVFNRDGEPVKFEIL